MLDPDLERQRLDFEARVDVPPAGFRTVELLAVADEPLRTQDRCKSVMAEVLGKGSGSWPSVAAWRDALPLWFVEACRDETAAERMEWLEWWRGLPSEEQSVVARSRAWSLDNWLSWIEPGQRPWFWWGSSAVAGEITIEVLAGPDVVPLGALEWLLTAAGASSVDIQD